MPRNGSGTFDRVHNWQNDAANNIRIRADRMDADTNDIANALTNSIAKDGQTEPTANLPMGGFRHTGVGSAVNEDEYATLGQVNALAVQEIQETKADLEATVIDANVDALFLQGYHTAGDGGAALYRRVASEPTHPAKIQSSDGAWWEIAENEPNLKQFGGVLDGSTDDTQAWRDMMDYAYYVIRTTSGPRAGVKVTVPPGLSVISDELLSDQFQEDWWNQTGIGPRHYILVEGAGEGSSQILVSDSFLSGVRNLANGNQRTYGPWANEPSPSILWPTIANPSSGVATLNLHGIHMVGSNRLGKDPIPFYTASEQSADHRDLWFESFKNYGCVINGSFNAVHKDRRSLSCGQQPVECGSILGRPAGFFPSYVQFDCTGTTVSAKAERAFDTFVAGDPVPFFLLEHVGKTFVVQDGADHGNNPGPLKVTIDSVAADSSTSAEVTFPTDGPSDWLGGGVTDRWGSFLPVLATTTATSTSITLSAPVLFGAGAADMVGMMIAIPKAGSPSVGQNDIFCSRIASCDVGNDTDGYTELTMHHAPAFSVTDYFITSIGHSTVVEESLAALGTFLINDTDFINCQWAHASAFGDNPTSSSFQLVLQDCVGDNQFISCKVHGHTVRGNFAADGQIIIDRSDGNVFSACNFAHNGVTGQGQIRFMGARSKNRFMGLETGNDSWSHDFSLFYADPQTGYDVNDWGNIEIGTVIQRNSDFPVFEQKIKSGRGLTPYRIHELFQDDRRRPEGAVLIDSTVDIDDVVIPGDYAWDTSIPTNAPLNVNRSIMTVSLGHPKSLSVPMIHQVIRSINTEWRMERYKFGANWSVWQYLIPQLRTTSDFSDSTNQINQVGKNTGVIHMDTTTGLFMMALGSSPTDDWQPSDGSAVVTPV